MAYNLGTASGSIRIEYDSRGVARARDDLGRFVSLSSLASDAMDDNDRHSRKLSLSLSGLGKAFLVMTKYVTITATAVQTLITTINVLGAVIAAVAPIVGATLATLPAILFSAITAALVLKTAFIGVGDALKAAVSGDAEKLAEATKNLAPNAKAFAFAIADATKKLKPLQQAIQQAFFAGLAQQLPGIVAALGQTKNNAVALSTAFNGVTKQLFLFAQSPQFILATQAAMTGVANVLNILAPAILPVLQGFAQMARNGAELAIQIKGNLAPAAQRLGEFLSKFDIAAAFKNGIAALQPLIKVISDLSIIITTIIKDLGAFNDSGSQLLGTFGSILDVLAQFVQTDAATAGFQALGEAFNAIAGAVGQVLMPLLVALAPAVAAIAPLFTVLARVLGNLLTSAIAILAPILLKLVTALDGALGPILPEIAAALDSVFQALGPVLDLIATNLTPFLIAIAPVIEQVAKNLGVMLVAAIQQLMPPLQDLLPVIVQFAQEVGPSLVELLAALAKGFVAAAPMMLLMANIAIGALVPVLKVMIPVIATLVGWLATLVGWLATVIGWVAGFIGKWTEATKITALIQGVFSTVVSIITWAINLARSLVGGGIASMQAAFGSLSAVIGVVTAVFGSVRNAIAGAISSAVAVVRGLPGQISAAIGNLGGLLYNAGQQVVQGLVNGIRSLAGSVAAAARDAVAGIPGVVKNLLGISSPSRVMVDIMREVPAGAVKGILDGTRDVLNAAQAMASSVFSGMPTDFSASVSSTVAASIGASSGALGGTAAAVAPVVAGGVVNNVTVNAPQNMNPDEVAQRTASRLNLSLNTRGTAPAAA